MAQSKTHTLDVYQPHNPKASTYYKCVENHFEELERAYPKGQELSISWHSLANAGNFVHLAIKNGLYPEGQKLEYGEWLLTKVLKDVPHRHWVFSIPKRLQIYFLYDRKLLAKLSVCAWNVIKGYLQSAAPGSNAVPGASISVQT